MQVTGSFKIRGATNAVLQLSDDQILYGVVTHRWVRATTHSSSQRGLVYIRFAWGSCPQKMAAKLVLAVAVADLQAPLPLARL